MALWTGSPREINRYRAPAHGHLTPAVLETTRYHSKLSISQAFGLRGFVHPYRASTHGLQRGPAVATLICGLSQPQIDHVRSDSHTRFLGVTDLPPTDLPTDRTRTYRTSAHGRTVTSPTDESLTTVLLPTLSPVSTCRPSRTRDVKVILKGLIKRSSAVLMTFSLLGRGTR